MTGQGPQRLRDAWHRLTAALGADTAAATSVWQELHARYAEPGRAYHTWSHIDHVHQVMEWMLTRVVAERLPVELAVFFHDAVYRTTAFAPDDVGQVGAPAHATDNEVESARFARAACGLMALPDDVAIAVHDLVLCTRDHVADGQEQAVLCDADLAILASAPGTYDIYRRAIRVEYANVDEAAFQRGRAAVLRRFLEREHIYATPLMRDRGESIARGNLMRELALIG